MEIRIHTNEWKAPGKPVIPSGMAPTPLSPHCDLCLEGHWSSGKPLRSLNDLPHQPLCKTFPCHPGSHPQTGAQMPFFTPQIPTPSSNVLPVTLLSDCSWVPTSNRGPLAAGPPLTFVRSSTAIEYTKVNWTRTWVEHWRGRWATPSVFTHLLIFSLTEWPQIHQGNRELICVLHVKNKLAFATPLPWYKPQAHQVFAPCYLNCTPIKTFWEADEVMEERSQSEQNLFLH